jgi:hypothetical protein
VAKKVTSRNKADKRLIMAILHQAHDEIGKERGPLFKRAQHFSSRFRIKLPKRNHLP